ncbi:MAG: transposase, partial [Burkholderiales bacterium]
SRRALESQVIGRFLQCGDPHHGIARVYCNACGLDYLLAYSCKTRSWLGELCRIAARLLADAYAQALPGARPGLILFVQTFGDLANFNPHVHVLAADGAFGRDGRFVPLLAVPEVLLTEGFRRAVLAFFVSQHALSEDLRGHMLGWRHSGFSVHNQVRITAEDAEACQ